MYDKKPALVLRERRTGRFIAWNEDGRVIGQPIGYRLYESLMIVLAHQSYEAVSPNSRCARGIMDKLKEKAKRKGWI